MAEKEYIERGAIVKFIQEGLNNSDKSKAFGHDAIEILAEVFVMPAADVVEMVRCKDCKFWSAMDDGFSFHNRGRTDGECEMLLERHYSERHLTCGEHFCSYGERKSEN